MTKLKKGILLEKQLQKNMGADEYKQYKLTCALRDQEIEAGEAAIRLEKDEITKNASDEFMRGWKAANNLINKRNNMIIEAFNKNHPEVQ